MIFSQVTGIIRFKVTYVKDETTNMDEIQPQTMIPKADDYTNEVERQQVLLGG